MKDSELRARYNYRAKGKRLQLDLYPSEQDIIDWLDKQPSKATYIKDLIRQDMKKES